MQTTTPRRPQGFTLIEMMMALAALAILVSLAAPAFGSLIESTEAATSRNALRTALATARTFAAGKSAHVVVCPSADQQYCGRTTQWQHGWIIFIDADRDAQRSPDEDLLGASQALPEGVAIVSTSGRTRVNYRPDGSATGSNVTFTICDKRGADAATTLVINNAGRVRPGKPSPAAAASCVSVLDAPRA